MRQDGIISIWLFNVYMDSDGAENRVRDNRIIGFLFADNVNLSNKLEEDLWAIVGHFVEVCRKKRSESQNQIRAR